MKVDRYVSQAVKLLFCIVYWLLFAESNNMIFYYRISVYPLLKETGTPNPFFFFHGNNFISAYNSGVEWFPTGHIILMLLIGNTFFSVLITALVVKNTAAAWKVLKLDAVKNDVVPWRNPVLWLLLLTAVMSLSPLSTLGVIFVEFVYRSPFLEYLSVLAGDYSYITFTFDSAILYMTVLGWRKIGAERAAARDRHIT
jgi:hypothetical protein